MKKEIQIIPVGEYHYAIDNDKNAPSPGKDDTMLYWFIGEAPKNGRLYTSVNGEVPKCNIAKVIASNDPKCSDIPTLSEDTIVEYNRCGGRCKVYTVYESVGNSMQEDIVWSQGISNTDQDGNIVVEIVPEVVAGMDWGLGIVPEEVGIKLGQDSIEEAAKKYSETALLSGPFATQHQNRRFIVEEAWKDGYNANPGKYTEEEVRKLIEHIMNEAYRWL